MQVRECVHDHTDFAHEIKMRKVNHQSARLIFGRSVLMAVLAGPLLAMAAADDYVLSTGDEIRIDVYEESDLTMQVRLDQSGVINYPYLGELRVIGRSVDQVERAIYQGLLGDILIKPSVNVSVSRYRNFFVKGEVKQVGGFEYQPGMTVEQAITMAGGLTEFGSERRIQLKREGSARAEDASLNTRIRPGDTITVMEGGIF